VREPAGELEANKALVRRFAATLSAGDLDSVARFFDDDSTWTIEASGIEGAGTHRGRAIIEEFLRPVRGMFEPGDPKLAITRLVAEGPLVVMEARGTGLLRNGSPYDNRYAFVFELDGAKIRAIREYMDTHHAYLAAASDFSPTRPTEG
jgi:hypothetical protein